MNTINPMTGLPVQQMTNVPPAPSSLKDPFNPQAQATAAGLFGNQQALQNSVNAPALYMKSKCSK